MRLKGFNPIRGKYQTSFPPRVVFTSSSIKLLSVLWPVYFTSFEIAGHFFIWRPRRVAWCVPKYIEEFSFFSAAAFNSSAKRLFESLLGILPFDIATDRRFLIGVYLMPCDERIHGSANIFSIIWNIITWPASIDLPTINQSTCFVI